MKNKQHKVRLEGLILSQPSTDSALCGGSLLEGTRAKPPLKGEVPAACGRRGLSPRRIGRGGSVSRRDHNQLTGNRTQLAWAHKSEGTHKPIPSYSSGEGVWGRGASLREAASPPARITYITNHTAASWGGRLAVRRVGGASMPVQSSVAAQGARSREARGRETVRGSSERLKSAT